MRPNGRLVGVGLRAITFAVILAGCNGALRPTCEEGSGVPPRVAAIRANGAEAKGAQDLIRARLAEPIVTEKVDTKGMQWAQEGSRILTLSGGTEWGAYGAGYLSALLDTRSGPVDGKERIPYRTYKVITGISTGALLATYAFIGDTEGMRIYTRVKQEDVFSVRTWSLFFGRGSGFTTTTPLRNKITEEITNQRLQRVLAEGERGRSLIVGAVDMDSGEFHAFDLTKLLKDEQNRQGNPDASEIQFSDELRSAYIDLLLASAAIPVAMPVVWIGCTPYVDGGVRNSIFAVDPDDSRGSRPAEAESYVSKSFLELVMESLDVPDGGVLPEQADGRRLVPVERVDLIVNGRILLEEQKLEEIRPFDVGMRTLDILLTERARDDRDAVMKVKPGITARMTTADLSVSGSCGCPVSRKRFDPHFMQCLFDGGRGQAGNWIIPTDMVREAARANIARTRTR